MEKVPWDKPRSFVSSVVGVGCRSVGSGFTSAVTVLRAPLVSPHVGSRDCPALVESSTMKVRSNGEFSIRAFAISIRVVTAMKDELSRYE